MENKKYLVERFNVNNKLVDSSVVSTEIAEIQGIHGASNSDFKNRVLNLFGGFNEATISEMMKQCLKWEEEDAEILYKHSQQIRQLRPYTIIKTYNNKYKFTWWRSCSIIRVSRSIRIYACSSNN